MPNRFASFERRVIASRSLPVPLFRYSPVVQAGPFVFLSGMVALDAATGLLIEGGVHDQTLKILENLRRLTDEMGWSLDQLAVARVYCADMAEFGEVNRAWETFFLDRVPPARTSLGATALPLGALVEIEFQLVVDNFAAM